MSRPVRLKVSAPSAKIRSQSLTERIQSVLRQAGYVPPTNPPKEAPVLSERQPFDIKLVKGEGAVKPAIKLDRNCTSSTRDTIDTSCSFFEPSSSNSFSNDLKDSQRSAQSRVKPTEARGLQQAKASAYHHQFLSFETAKPGKKPSSYRDKLRACTSAAQKPQITVAPPKHNFTNEFIEPQDFLPPRSPEAPKRIYEALTDELNEIVSEAAPGVKHRRRSSFCGGENDTSQPSQISCAIPSSSDRFQSRLLNDFEAQHRSMTTPATPKTLLSPREQGTKELLAVLKRKYGGCGFEIDPIQMPVDCPAVVLVCKGSRVQAFAVRAVRSVPL
jgi:hypothetical protein